MTNHKAADGIGGHFRISPLPASNSPLRTIHSGRGRVRATVISRNSATSDSLTPALSRWKAAGVANRLSGEGARGAFTLLEVILAMAILGVSLAIIGEGFRAGLRNIDEAQHEVRASLIAESVLSQIAAGAILPEITGETAYEFDPNWVYSIASEPQSDVEGLLAVSVIVHHVNQPRYSVTMSRWLTDPDWLAEQAANNPLTLAAEEAAATDSTSSSSSSGSGSSGSASGGSR